nr:polyprenyl synthetase family protein [Herbihabitans rhizosphaerae]
MDTRLAEITSLDEAVGAAARALADFVLGGGKRIRPTFAWWGWRGAGGAADGPEAHRVLTAVSALELLQACALVHDDVMDASTMRRGSPTVHVAFAARHRDNGWHGDSDHFGLAAAILLGDLALAWADDMFACSGVNPAALAAAAEPWRAMRGEMLAGQYLDVLSQVRGDVTEDAALRVARLKTAAYTVERPLHLGAALAGAAPSTVDSLREFGADIGVAFQLRDDLLGMFGDTDVTGKPAGDDLREGKRTLLVALGLRSDRSGLLRAALGRPDLDTDTVERVRSMLADVGAVADVEHRIGELTDSAMRALDAANLAEPAAGRLRELAIAATKRNR